ncbi:MAG: beta-glucosidase [Bacteroidetes bacterium 24-39-8]|jgi:hypothetical protein|nr:MAG: beta-glucosidase [Bacteroidetes bacterium 24-39-8]OZA65936.1 MAG: beta-glucosidase [Sphingobacteriia bacterium 39-39-8]HQR92105.1 glucoamylase family protein [Sediminibacterium sp.]HQS54850.1 glucoamylase family protein [Sediminibacterium sp.]
MKKLLLFSYLIIYGIVNAPLAQTNKTVQKFKNKEEETVFNKVQQASFEYFRKGAEPNSGMGRERIHLDGNYPENDQSTVTSGGSGFGVMALLVGIERKYISRKEGVEHLDKILHFLETADRFKGAWPHWWYGETGKVRPFGTKDNGGDLVETSYMLQGLLCLRQYFQNGTLAEKALAARADKLWKEVDFDWYRNGQNVLYWHWSPDYAWQMNFPVRGYNECLIMYVLAASSPSHGVPASVYHQGWADNGKIKADSVRYAGISLQLHHQGNPVNGGPLFWSQYSYLGLDPRGLKDAYADYWKENTNQSLINYRWCVDNPKKFKGYTPEQSMAAMMHWYNTKKEKLFGEYGFYDAFSETDNWYLPRYLAIDQGPIVVMMENYRSGLLWDLFMNCPEIKIGLKKLGFQSPQIK